jgi:hypothetical protein
MNERDNTPTGVQAMNENCIRTLTLWTCEFDRGKLTNWTHLDGALHELVE